MQVSIGGKSYRLKVISIVGPDGIETLLEPVDFTCDESTAMALIELAKEKGADAISQ